MRTVGGKVHSHDSNCIYSVAKSNGDSIEFSLSIAEQRAVGFIPAWSLASLQEWWNQDCTNGLNKYRESGDLKHWKEFKSVVRTVKREFFDNKIHKIASSNKRPWDLMSWIRKKSFPAIKSISYENCPCNTLSDLWNALHKSYNSVENKPVNTRLLNKLSQADSIEWPPFSSQEFRDAIAKCSSSVRGHLG